jgi:subtilisin-like proprotein convertase family protein
MKRQIRTLRDCLLLWSLALTVSASAQVTTSTNFTVGAAIPDGATVGLASFKTVATPITSISDLEVTLKINGTYNGDLYCHLVHSSGFTVLLNRPGRRASNSFGYSDSGLDVTFDDSAANGDVHIYRLTLNGSHLTPLAGALTGTWTPDGRTNRPTTVLDTDTPTAMLSSFVGVNPNGEWVLFVADLAAGDLHTLDNWGLTITGFSGVSIVCPSAVTVSCASQVPPANTNSVTASGGCSGIIVTHEGDVMSASNCPNRFTITRSYKATDSCTNSVTCTQTITVNDTTVPTISCSTNIATFTTNSSGAIVSFTVTGSDNCSGSATVVCNPSSGSVFPVGTNMVNCTATDDCGNSSTCSFMVTVTLNHAPVAGNNNMGAIENRTKTVTHEKLLANDSDEDGDTLTITAVSATSTNGGTVILSSTEIHYTPTTNFVGLDRFSYTVSDGRGGIGTASVLVQVLSHSDPSLNRIGEIFMTPNGVRIRFVGIPNFDYTVQRSTDLETWSDIGTVSMPDNGIAEFEDTNPPSGSAFYRTMTPE